MKRNSNELLNTPIYEYLTHGVKYGEDNKYIYRANNNLFAVYKIADFYYDYRHTENIYCKFEIDNNDETKLKLIINQPGRCEQAMGNPVPSFLTG